MRIVFLAVMTMLLTGCGYNDFQTNDEQVKADWAEVLNQYQRRFDLVPNLVNTVKGYAAHEKDILEEVTRLRSQWGQAANIPDKVAAANSLGGALSRLLMVSESYPNLKADQHVLRLQEELTSTENKISLARQQYNEDVNRLNVNIQVFPDSLVAVKTGFEKAAFFQMELAEDRQVPLVKF